MNQYQCNPPNFPRRFEIFEACRNIESYAMAELMSVRWNDLVLTFSAKPAISIKIIEFRRDEYSTNQNFSTANSTSVVREIWFLLKENPDSKSNRRCSRVQNACSYFRSCNPLLLRRLHTVRSESDLTASRFPSYTVWKRPILLLDSLG